VLHSKTFGIAKIYCSSYYTLIVNDKGEVTMFGTLKGFAKFLFDSPSKDDNADIMATQCSKMLDLRKEKVTEISLAEKSFLVYAGDTHRLYIVNENFKPTCVLQRELK
jgi:hypothetical protein